MTWYEYDNNNVDIQEVNFSHFEDFDMTQGDDGNIPCYMNHEWSTNSITLGDTLAFHPKRPKTLFIVPFNASFVGSFWLQPLCFQNQPKSEKCDVHFNKCCGNGDCYNNKCQCYPGWSKGSNCCESKFWEKYNFVLDAIAFLKWVTFANQIAPKSCTPLSPSTFSKAAMPLRSKTFSRL